MLIKLVNRKLVPVRLIFYRINTIISLNYLLKVMRLTRPLFKYLTCIERYLISLVLSVLYEIL